MNTIEAIKTWRSTRKYINKAVEEDKLKTILEAAIYAPSGGNSQSCHFIVIENKDVLKKLNLLVKDEFSKMEIVEGMYKSLKTTINISKKEDYSFIYNAPVLIVVTNKKEYGNAMADSACAIENMLICANELDLGSCYINQLKWLNDSGCIVKYMNSLGLKDDEVIMESVCVGYPDSENGLPVRTPLKRIGNEITYIK